MLDLFRSSYKASLVLFIGFLTIQCALGLYDIEVYRLLGYEENGATYGSKIASLNFMASHFTGNLLRKMAVIHFTEINQDNLSLILKQKTTGILIILPTNKTPAETERAIWDVIESNFMSKVLHIPVYFCWESEVVMKAYNSLQSASQGKKSDDDEAESKFNFIVNSDEPKLASGLFIDDFFGSLEESATGKGSTNPVILVAASYDSYSMVPDLKIGMNEYASGAIGLLNIARHLSQFYKSNHKLKYNVLFYLSGGRTFNYEGLNIWLAKADYAKYVNKIEAAIFLESIGTEPLYVDLYNTDSQASDFESGEIMSTFNDVTKLYDVKTVVTTLPTPLLNNKFPVIRIAHASNVSFANKEQPSLQDNLDQRQLERNILFLTELLIKTSYNIKKDFPVFDHNYIDHEYLKTALDFFSSRPRSVLAVNKDSTFSQDLFRVFSDEIKQANKYTFSHSSPKFYSSKVAKLSVTRTSSPFMDLYIFVGVLTYLWALYTVLNSFNKSSSTVVETPSATRSKEPGSGSATQRSRSNKDKKDQ
jgi:hypothetical protein